MIEARERARLAPEARPSVLVLEELFRQHLQGDRPLDARVLRPIDLPHTAGSEGRKDFVRSEADSGCDRHLFDRIVAMFGAPSRPRLGESVDGRTAAV